MSAEIVPASVNFDNNLRITLTALADDPLSASVLAAGTDVTYSLKTFNLTETQQPISYELWGSRQGGSIPGKITVACEVQYIFGDSGDVAKALLVEGFKGHATLRYSVTNSADWAIGQVVDVVTFTAGAQRKDPPVRNGVQTITQGLYVSAVVKDAVVTA